ncbi:hypothetical protein C1H76_5045 [Elsinoe australis]|uniref:Uncharacterized protein n=1 Tax=Elsinoe australis TaxID=40998 RepID=A0A4U7AW21_9PEZI|nr:hypothetical protein C1H76_5045 [Elsinoe australis]
MVLRRPNWFPDVLLWLIILSPLVYGQTSIQKLGHHEQGSQACQFRRLLTCLPTAAIDRFHDFVPPETHHWTRIYKRRGGGGGGGGGGRGGGGGGGSTGGGSGAGAATRMNAAGTGGGSKNAGASRRIGREIVAGLTVVVTAAVVWLIVF